MTTYNSNFELTMEDVELIENALRQSKRELSAQTLDSCAQPDKVSDRMDDAEDTLRQIHDLLGRLHNQKIFFRPRSGSYIGG
ncbi:hypothetical protein [Roseovarius litorisediminis]|nr:hypothetical protein [Roseovarius litorisediminis]